MPGSVGDDGLDVFDAEVLGVAMFVDLSLFADPKEGAKTLSSTGTRCKKLENGDGNGVLFAILCQKFIVGFFSCSQLRLNKLSTKGHAGLRVGCRVRLRYVLNHIGKLGCDP